MSKHHGFGMGGKGYYIALILCAGAIGLTGFLYRRNNQKAEETQPPLLQAETTQTRQTEGEIPVLAPTVPRETRQETTAATETTAPKSKLKTAAPLESVETLAEYAMENLAYNETTRDWRTHDGLDMAAEAGTPVLAAAAGTVTEIRQDDALGCVITLRHSGGYETRYACLAQQINVTQGENVALGQQLGTVGQTALMESALGPHLHFQVSCQGKSVNPEDFLSPEE